VEHTPDGWYVVVDGWRWRATERQRVRQRPAVRQTARRLVPHADGMTNEQRAMITETYVQAEEALAAFARGPEPPGELWHPDLAEYDCLGRERDVAEAAYRKMLAEWTA